METIAKGDSRNLLLALVRDRVFQVAAALVVLISLPIGPQAARESFFEYWADFLILPAVMAFLALRRRGSHGRERAFWSLWIASFGCWLLVRGLMIFAPDRFVGRPLDVTTDVLYVVFYLLLFLASSLRPHEPEEDISLGRPELLPIFGATILTFSLLTYFVFLPAQWQPEAYGSWRPSMLHYVTLDVVATLRFLQLRASAQAPRWRLTYLLLAATTGLWAVTDGLESATYSGHLTLAVGGLWDLLWNLPLLTLVGAVRVRSMPRSATEPMATSEIRTAPSTRIGSFVVLAAITLPVVHLTLHATGLLDRSLQQPREWIVLVATLILASLAALEHTQLRNAMAASEQARRQARRRLRERTAHLRALIEYSPLAIVSMDTDYKVRLVNPAFEGLFGFGQTEVKGKSLMPYIGSDELHDEMIHFGNWVMEGRLVHRMTRRQHRSGRLIDVEVLCVPYTIDTRTVGILALYVDRTDQARAEQERRAGEERLQSLAAASFEGIVIVEDRRIVDVNGSFAAMFGVAAKELIGRPVLELVAEDHRVSFDNNVRQAFEGPIEVVCLRADGTTFHAELQGKAITYRGQPALVGALRDLTERLKLEAQLRQAQKMEAIGALAGGIAHDFNNLLTVILGRSALLVSGAETADTRIHAEEIQSAGELAASLTRQLLVFARKQTVQPEHLDLNTMAAHTIETVVRRLIREDVALRLQLATELPLVLVDRGQVEQVILNLALNAQDAMPKGGTLSISTAVVEMHEPRSAFGLRIEPGTYVQLMVRDTGVGIAPERFTNLFDPFFTTKTEGTGLGLATVYGVVEQGGGLVDVESAEGQGAAFEVLIPATDVVEAVEPTDPPTPGTRTRPSAVDGQVVLVVEDVAEIGAMLVRFLEREGYTVLRSDRPRKALELARTYPGTIDLMLTDVVMPEMDGPTLAEAVLALRPETRVLYMSGYAADEAFRNRVERGAGAFLAKPFSLTDLASKVREVLAASTASPAP